jgi:hypothetical protein
MPNYGTKTKASGVELESEMDGWRGTKHERQKQYCIPVFQYSDALSGKWIHYMLGLTEQPKTETTQNSILLKGN